MVLKIDINKQRPEIGQIVMCYCEIFYYGRNCGEIICYGEYLGRDTENNYPLFYFYPTYVDDDQYLSVTHWRPITEKHKNLVIQKYNINEDEV